MSATTEEQWVTEIRCNAGRVDVTEREGVARITNYHTNESMCMDADELAAVMTVWLQERSTDG